MSRWHACWTIALLLSLVGACSNADNSSASGGIMGAAGSAGARSSASAAGSTGSLGMQGASTARPIDITDAGPRMIGSGPTFTRVFGEVLTAKNCNSTFCHRAGMGGLTITDKATAYMNLVNVRAAGPSCGSSGKLRVRPGDPALSLMFDKMSNPTPSCGDTMPVGAKLAPNCDVPDDPAMCTTEKDLDLVKAWITAGALDD